MQLQTPRCWVMTLMDLCLIAVLLFLLFATIQGWRTSFQGHYVVYNVMDFNARGDGVTDDSQAFLEAWYTACGVESSTVLVPKFHTFLLMPISFMGPCAFNLTMQVEGTIVAPESPNAWMPEYRNAWIEVINAVSFTIGGAGIIDGRGHLWWDYSCKRKPSIGCNSQSAPTALIFYGGRDITIKGIRIQNSQQMNLAFVGCDGVRVTSVRIQCPKDSPNTDGIHLGASRNVVIEHSAIGTGDDCISIGSGSVNVVIKNLLCGPGHGISVGSLGKDNSVAYVSNILVHRVRLSGTTNGLRIKTWQGGHGRASDMRFENVTMHEVANPILIDQYYCDSQHPCKTQKAAVQVRNITYSHIAGTSMTDVATNFACSETSPCLDILLHNIHLMLPSGAEARSNCKNVVGSATGTVVPASCL